MVLIYGTFNIRNVTSNFKNFLNAKFGYVSTHCLLKLSIPIVTPRKLPAKTSDILERKSDCKTGTRGESYHSPVARLDSMLGVLAIVTTVKQWATPGLAWAQKSPWPEPPLPHSELLLGFGWPACQLVSTAKSRRRKGKADSGTTWGSPAKSKFQLEK